MKLPALSKSRKKIRDSQIIHAYVTEKQSRDDIAKRFNVTTTRISQILMVNASAIVNNLRDYSKLNRINLLEKALLSEDIPFARNKTDIIDALRKENESDRSNQPVIAQQFQVFFPSVAGQSGNAIEINSLHDAPQKNVAGGETQFEDSSNKYDDSSNSSGAQNVAPVKDAPHT